MTPARTGSSQKKWKLWNKRNEKNGRNEKTGETEELDESGESEDNSKKCSKCHQYNTGIRWCHPCNVRQFQNELDKWASGDREIDEFIQQIQFNAKKLLN
ncbi:hypothetical protein Glove_313g26 [Diversispora epigaea]|uniref:Uncharacterized protein n=1 Tax=Diversispora epigaea TaxID=1348612 RepID=A0A397HR02_9GLOM|nr:hypothetical protein Glove_313g26 [Diversispora epigaea]